LKKTTSNTQQAPTSDAEFDFVTLNKGSQTLVINVKEEDRGGIQLSQVFVKHNRVFETMN
jgi:hypothetical protein